MIGLKSLWLRHVGAAVLAAPFAMLSLPGTAHATLHAFCYGTSACSDNGTVTPVSTNPPGFGFKRSPNSGTYDLLMDVLIPDNASGGNSESFSISGTHTANSAVLATLFNSSPWTSGFLSSYLGISGPANPLNAWLPTTNALQPAATGYYVYKLDFGSVTFGSSTDPEFTTAFGFPAGSVVTAFAKSCTSGRHGTTCSYDATANSAALFVATSPVPTPDPDPVSTPEPAGFALLGTGLIALAVARRRRA